MVSLPPFRSPRKRCLVVLAKISDNGSWRNGQGFSNGRTAYIGYGTVKVYGKSQNLAVFLKVLYLSRPPTKRCRKWITVGSHTSTRLYLSSELDSLVTGKRYGTNSADGATGSPSQ